MLCTSAFFVLVYFDLPSLKYLHTAMWHIDKLNKLKVIHLNGC